MPEYRILTISEREQWSGYLAQLPPEQQDIYYTPEYYELFADLSKGIIRCFVFSDGDKLALYPFYLGKINDLGYELDKEYYDVQGVYGYNGIVSNTTDQGFLNKFADKWAAWCSENNIVAEFIRYNPVLQNHNNCPWAPPIETLDNVLLPLTNYEDIWNHSYDRSVRNAIRKTSEYNLTFALYSAGEISELDYNTFVELYNKTMVRREADHFYFFDDNFFNDLRAKLPNKALLAFAYHDGKAISADLYLHNSINIYGFLSGTLKDYFHMKPSSFLRDMTIKTLINKGFSNYSIGGGLNRYDSIYKYKKAFSVKTDSLFYIGKCIHNIDVYNNVKNQWCLNYPHLVEKYQRRVLCYRDVV